MAGTGTAHLRPADEALLRVEDLVVEFRRRRPARCRRCRASASTCAQGETLGLVGESGCGKSTTGRAVLQLPPPDRAARCCFDGTDLTALRGADAAATCAAAADDLPGPDLLAEPAPARRATSSPSRCGSGPGHRRRAAWRRSTRCSRPSASTPRWPGRSGPTSSPAASASASPSPGRWCSTRALLICDEPVSALDVSVQAQILNLLEDMKARYGLTMVFIAHDLAVVKNISDRVAVMYLGKLCEVGPPDQLYRSPGAPVHGRAAPVHPRPRPDRAADRRRAAPRRAAVAARPAVGLPLPHPLPARRGALRRGGAGDAVGGRGPLRRLPLPARAVEAETVAAAAGAVEASVTELPAPGIRRGGRRSP